MHSRRTRPDDHIVVDLGVAAHADCSRRKDGRKPSDWTVTLPGVEELRHHVDHCGSILGGRTGQAEEIDQPEPVTDDAGEKTEGRVETVFVHQALLPRLEHIGSRTKFAITGRRRANTAVAASAWCSSGRRTYSRYALAKRLAPTGCQLVKPGRGVGERLLEHAGDELLLRAEVMQQATLRHTCLLSHPCKRHRLDAVATHNRCGGVEQLHAGLRRSGLLGAGRSLTRDRP